MTTTGTPQRNRSNLRNSPDGIGREKHCSRCKDWWPADAEFFSTNARNGLAYWCKACSLEVQRDKRAQRRAASVATPATPAALREMSPMGRTTSGAIGMP